MNLQAGGATLTATLQLKDAQGNALSRGGGRAITIQSTNPAIVQIGTVADPDNGTFTATVTPIGAGAATVYATIKGVTITATVELVVSEVDPDLSQVLADATNMLADGATAMPITVYVADTLGAPFANVTVVMAATGAGTNTFSSPVVTNAAGFATLTFTTTAAVTHIISATVRGITITQTSTITGVSPQPTADATRTTISAAASTVVEGGTVAITVQAKQAQGTNITIGGDAVTLGLSGGTAAASITATPIDNGDGTYVGTFAATTAGTAKTITGTINGVTISGGTLPTIAVTTAVASFTPGDILDNFSFAGNSWYRFYDSGVGTPQSGATGGTLSIVNDQPLLTGTYSAKRVLPVSNSVTDDSPKCFMDFARTTGSPWFMPANPANQPQGTGTNRLYVRFDTVFDGPLGLSAILKFQLLFGYGNNEQYGGIYIRNNVLQFILPEQLAFNVYPGYGAQSVIADGAKHTIEYDYCRNGNDVLFGYAGDYPSVKVWIDGTVRQPTSGMTNGNSWDAVNQRYYTTSTRFYTPTHKIGLFAIHGVLNHASNDVLRNCWINRISVSTAGRVGP